MSRARPTGAFAALVAYIAATLGVLVELGGTWILADDGVRTAVLAGWASVYSAIVGLAWLSSALVLTAVAFYRRAVGLALFAAASFLVTAALAYMWAVDTAYEGAGAWDVLRWITIGGMYPLVGASLVVGTGAALTVARRSREPRQRLT